MTERVYGDVYPQIRRLQGVILFPHDVQQETVVDAAGIERQVFSWIDLRIEDLRQPITNRTVFMRQHYGELRAQLYPSWPDQLDKIYHDGIDAWRQEMVDPVKQVFPKS